MSVPDIPGNLPVIRAHYADILCQLAEDMGVSRQALLSASGIRLSTLDHPDNLVSVDQFTALCQEALARCGDDTLGLEYGKRLKFTTHGPLSQAAVSCDTLGQGISVLIKYFRIRFAHMDLSFFIEGDDAVLQLELAHGVKDLYRFNVEVVVAALIDVNLLLFGKQLLSQGRCLLNYPRPANSSVYGALFGHRVEFETGVNQLRFHKQFLNLPLSLSNPVARRVAEAQCEKEMRSIEAATSVAVRASRLLKSVRKGRLPSLNDIAAQMALSPRTLRRQLASEGARFQQLQDEIRHERALELLRQNELSIDQVADALGYSDPSNFGRAFRKWEGLAPSLWRAQAEQRY